jgi:hypothetical protein
MPEIDDELLARAVRWCAAAGQHTSPEEVRAALAPLSWDQLLAVRACLADPPPAQLPGPLALAYLARGASPGAAMEQSPPGRRPQPRRPASGGEIPPSPRSRRPPAARPLGPIIRRATDRPPSRPPATPLEAPLDELSESEGRSTLERLVREHGARRGPLLEAMRRRWRRADGGAPDDEDLDRLLSEHGLSRAFARRERDEILHALRAAGGDRRRAAAAVGIATADALDGAVARLGATAQVEAIREGARLEIRRRATLTERARLLLFEEEHLRDLGLLPAIESDLAARLPEHILALRASGPGPLPAALGRSLSLRPADAQLLVHRLGLDVAPSGARGDSRGADARSGPPRRPRPRPRRRQRR